MAARGRRGNRGPRGGYVTVEMFEELQEQFRNLIQAMNFQNQRNSNDEESDHVGGARNGINKLSEAENDSLSDGERLGNERRVQRNERLQRWDDCIVRALQSSKESGVQVHISEFDGDMEAEEFLDWVDSIESCFEWKEPEERKVKLMGAKLRGPASTWCKHYQNDCENRGKGKVRRWDKIKEKLKAQFLPQDYEQTLYQRVQNLR